MKLNQKQIELIKADFHKMQDKTDLLKLINFVKKLLNLPQTVPLFIDDLTYQAYFFTKPRYNSFTIKKKNGSIRTILAPNESLKVIQQCLNVIFESVFQPHNTAHGFTPNKSVATNAGVHTGQNYVYNIDLKDFFFSVDQARVWACLQNPPFNLKDTKLEIANLIAALCCEELLVERLNTEGVWIKVKKKVLPQGAPTSPMLTNVIAQRLDFNLSKLAKRHNLKYSRYADDITFSSMHHVYKQDSEFMKELRQIITEQNFYINEKKTRLQENSYGRQEVTGLVVNEKVNVKRSYIKDLRRWLYLLERYGFERTNDIFIRDYLTKRTKKPYSNGEPNVFNVLSGKLDYLKMVVRFNDERYKKLYSRFEKQYEKIHPHEDAENKKQALKKKSDKNDIIDIIDLSKHKPKDVTTFLSLFRSGELKWLTHELDKAGHQFILKDMVEKAYSEFDLASKQLLNKGLPKSLYARIQSFITGKNSKEEKVNWWFLKQEYKFNWASSEVKEWSKKNPYLHPILNEKYQNEINIFKSSIQIKNNLTNLKDLIINIATAKFKSQYPKYEIEYIGLDRAEFFTDVEKLNTGLGHIFNTIEQQSNKDGDSKKIKIEYKRVRTITEDYKRLRIIHLESEPSKLLDDIFTDINNRKGDLSSVKNEFFQICDWSIILYHPDSSDHNKINILYDINKITSYTEKTDEQMEGFTHELKFYS